MENPIDQNSTNLVAEEHRNTLSKYPKHVDRGASKCMETRLEGKNA